MKRMTIIFTLAIFLCHAENFAFGQLVIGHRGASADAPENTLAAFNLAWQRGVLMASKAISTFRRTGILSAFTIRIPSASQE